MRSIQEVGVEVLGGQPKTFYVWVGTEYGIKEKYLSVLTAHYKEFCEVDTVSAVMNIMRTRRLIPLEPCLYIVRYDESFIASLDDHTAADIAQTNIRGTVVCIYESEKAAKKLDKYLPDYTVSIDPVDRRFVQKYLSSDFPQVCDRFLSFAATYANSYSHARNMTRCVQAMPQDKVTTLSDAELSALFGINVEFSESAFIAAIIRRDLRCIHRLISLYSGTKDELIYMYMRALIDIEKYKVRRNAEPALQPHIAAWTLENIYNLFSIAYDGLKSVRAGRQDPSILLDILCSLLVLSKVPTQEELQWT